jgi:hypothetical protein
MLGAGTRSTMAQSGSCRRVEGPGSISGRSMLDICLIRFYWDRSLTGYFDQYHFACALCPPLSVHHRRYIALADDSSSVYHIHSYSLVPFSYHCIYIYIYIYIYIQVFQKSIRTLKAYRNLYRGHTQCFELSKCSKTHRVLPRIVIHNCFDLFFRFFLLGKKEVEMELDSAAI